ncbi:hypothetical protein EJB05_02041, partial [Eragrostis curvula]
MKAPRSSVHKRGAHQRIRGKCKRKRSPVHKRRAHQRTRGKYKRTGNFCLDTTNKTVKDACVDMLKSGTRQLRYRLKKKYFDGVPANEVTTTSPVSSMTDEQWGKLVKMWSSPKHKEICLLNQHSREKVQFNHRRGSRCYIAQLHALRDKYKDEDPTPLELFKEFHSSQKTGFISEPVQKAIDHMEAMMDNPVEEGQEPPSTESAVREVVRSNTFLRVVGISPKKRSRVSRSCQFQDLTWELYLEKVRSDELRETIEQQNLQLADLRKISVEATEARRTTTAQLEALRKEATQKAEMIQSFRMVLGVEGQVHPSPLVSE